MRVLIAWCLLATVCSAERLIFLVTPAGVYQSIVSDGGVPSVWQKISADVIVTGFGGNVPDSPDPTPPKPEPPAEDPIVTKIAEISRSVLRDKDDATAVAAIVDSLAKLGLNPKEFYDAIEMTMPLADTALSADGRLTQWSKQALAVTSDAAKIKAGLAEAWGITQSTLNSINAAAVNPAEVATGEAINWTQLITIIQMILTLLKNLGIGGGT